MKDKNHVIILGMLWSLVIIVFTLSVYVLVDKYVEIQGIATNDTWSYVGNLANVLGLFGFVISLFIMMPFKISRSIIKFLKHRTFPATDDVPAELDNYSALVFTVSRPDIPIWLIKAYKPSAVGLIGSAMFSESIETIEAFASEQGIPCFVRALENPDVVERAKRETAEVIKAIKAIGIEDIAVDVTGGKVPMSLGAFLAADEHCLDTLYVTAKYDKGQPISSTIKPLLMTSATPIISKQGS